MRVFVAGADGFIGRNLVKHLAQAGHQVVKGVRRTRPCDLGEEICTINFAVEARAELWAERLKGVDVVINAVGIARAGGNSTFENVHARGPCSLFDGCVLAGVKRVIQISALGSKDAPQTFQVTKRTADSYLKSLPLNSIIIRPSIVLGAGAASSSLFAAMAAWPVLSYPGSGLQQVQPIAVDDLCRGVVALLAVDSPSLELDAVGPEPISIRDLLRAFRQRLGLSKALEVSVPFALARLGALVGGYFLPNLPLSKDTVDMLKQGNTADPAPWLEATNISATKLAESLGWLGASSRVGARLVFLAPILRFSLAFIWIFTGIVCLFVIPPSDGYALLAQAGLPSAVHPALFYLFSFLDLIFGIVLLIGWKVRAMLVLQAILVVGYSVAILFLMPSWWLHPFGPISKNIPLLAATLASWVLEDRA